MDANVHELVFKEEVFRIVGSAFNVCNTLGCGFLEAVYQEALEIEFRNERIPFESQKQITLEYKEHTLNKKYIADFFCFNCIIVEIKAIKKITEIEEAQLINYLKATRMSVGLILNFGSPKLEWKRIVNSQ